MTTKRVVLVFIMAIVAILAGVLFSRPTIGSIDLPFRGLSDTIADGKTVHLLVVHGMGPHCIGYSDRLVSGLAAHLGLKVKHEIPQDIKDNMKDYQSYSVCSAADLAPGRAVAYKSDVVDNQLHKVCKPLYEYNKSCMVVRKKRLGFIRTMDYVMQKGDPKQTRLRLYEVVWDPATRWAKTNYIYFLDHLHDDMRLLMNSSLKRVIINDSITDAVLYISEYKRHMQIPILIAMCKILMGSGVVDDENIVFGCDLSRVKQEFMETNEVAIISHSLGTRMIFDTLGLIADDRFPEYVGRVLDVPVDEELNEAAREASGIFHRSTATIFTLANQIPILEMGLVRNRGDYVNMRARKDLNGSRPPPADLGSGFDDFLQKRIHGGLSGDGVGNKSREEMPALQVVAFSDENDLLSYNLKCWYYLSVIRFKDGVRGKSKFDNCGTGEEQAFWRTVEEQITITEVLVNLGFRVPGLFADPIGAHSNYWQAEEVHRLIACGADKVDGSVKGKSCPRLN